MAIIIEDSLSVNNLRMAYNNDIFRFYSNDANNPATSAKVDLSLPGASSPSVSVTIYPNPQGRFFINLQPYVAALINKTGFEDNLQPNVAGLDISDYLYDVTTKVILKATMTITVRGASYSSSIMWTAGVEQLDDYMVLDKRQFHILLPKDKLANNQYYIKYWQGYPFDVTLFNGDNVLANINNYTLRNKTNTLSAAWQINKSGNVNIAQRLVFSDGRTDETIEDVLPLVEGYNKLIWFKDNENEANAKTIVLYKEAYKCGAYFKWLNKYGGYSYWLFENTFSIDRSSKQLGELERDNQNFGKALGRTVQMGKETQDTIRVVTELLSPEERRIVEGIINSPKVYYFTGQPFARNSYNNWIEVTLKNSNTRVRNSKEHLTNFVFDFELPTQYNQYQ